MKISLLLATFAIVCSSFSQNLEWIRHIGNRDQTKTLALSSDSEGNLYVVGTCEDTLDFDPGPGQILMSPEFFFIAKYDSYGSLSWVKNIARVENTCLTTSQLRSAVDENDNVYITGSFCRSIDFDPGPGTSILTGNISMNKKDIFILKLNTNGDFLWVKQLAGGFKLNAFDFEIQNEQLFLAGSFSDTIDFDPLINTRYGYSTLYGSDIFIASYNTLDGDYIGHKVFGTANVSEIIYDISVDAGGSLFGLCEFDGPTSISLGQGSYVTLPSDGSDHFMFKVSNLGPGFGCDWVQQFPGVSYASECKIKALSGGDFIIYGTAGNQIDLSPDGQTNDLVSQASYFARYNPAGVMMSANIFEQNTGENKLILAGLEEDNQGNIFISARLNGSFDVNLEDSVSLINCDSADIVLLKYNAAGNLLWAGSLENKSRYISYSLPLMCYNENIDAFFISDKFSGTYDFDPGIGVVDVESAIPYQPGDLVLNTDIFMLRLNNPLASLKEPGLNEFSFYPNPVHSVLTLTGFGSANSCIITGLSGNNVLSVPLMGNKIEIDIQNIANGFYLLQIDNYKTLKFVKK